MTPEKQRYPTTYAASEAMTVEEFLAAVEKAKAEYAFQGKEWKNSHGEVWEKYWRRKKVGQYAEILREIGENAKKAQNG